MSIPVMYLGDGAYAQVFGDMIEVYTDRLEDDGGTVRHYIYFEPETFAALLKFAKMTWPRRNFE